ncbi:S8 family peptidase [Rathayibacter toxicus]|uniref:S8 family peptidase n=1 Tax=Rathayibacter toxicus TaxID=145458 RepID=UPI001C040F8A|nr:S8 family peptidase [Rathayibacter toxicus]QWL31028.1 S8 family peptidase [Rathayibacter toxicus]
MHNEPIQLLLNTERLRAERETSTPVGNGTDFYAGNDRAFTRHRDGLAEALRAIRDALAADTQFGGVGYVKVTMQRDAIAKSHRPQRALFQARWTPHVATEGIGEPIFAVTPESLTYVIDAIESAETVVVDKTNKTTGVVARHPSRKRCEASAVASVALWTEQDRWSFSAAEAAAWLSRAGTGGRYIVTCFPVASASHVPHLIGQTMVAERRLNAVIDANRTTARPLRDGDHGGRVLTLGITASERSTVSASSRDDITESRVEAAVSSPAQRHQELLDALGRNPRVRSIALPPIISAEHADDTALGNEVAPDVLAGPDKEIASRVGVIDGGVGDNLRPWMGDRWGTLSAADRNTDHGTFISGLLVAAADLNPAYLSDQSRGCLIFDVDVLPADPGQTGLPFDAYYPGGVPQFLDEIEAAVKAYRRDHGVRIFNLSMNIQSPGDATRYGFTAARLDEIAKAHDVIFVISAGNLLPGDMRSEWHNMPDQALASLAADHLGFVAEPGESIQNVSVSALNPPGMPGQVPFALARYSRRGPGLRGATKPDFAHVGGSGTAKPTGNHGLVSVNEDGFLVSGCGTSYAAPLVARRLADLDALIDGNVSRDTLLALMVHFAHTPDVFGQKPILPVTHDLIGFGVPITAEKMLQRDDSEITLVVSSTLQPREDNWFEFTWPEALVKDGGRCSGQARLTLVASPPIAHEHGDERVRANIGARLMQRQDDGRFKGQMSPVNSLPAPDKAHKTERDLLKEAMKWQVVKSFQTTKMRGRGPSSQWKFVVDYLERTNEKLLDDGIEYAAVMTIADPTRQAPVFAQMRQHLNSIGIQTDDIRTSIRARATT